MPTGIYKRKPLTEEHKKNISLASKGRIFSEETKLKISRALTGKKLSEEHRVKCGNGKRGMSAWNKGLKGFNAKEKHWNWKGGVSKNKGIYRRIRRNLENNAQGSHTFGEWELPKKQYGYTCPCCEKSEPEIKLTEDHIIPLSKGGSDLIENIQPLCRSCNCKKGIKIIKFLLHD